MNNASAFSPAAISLLFMVCPNDDPLKMGSLGVGFTVNEGVVCRVRKSRQTLIKFNGREINFPTVASVLNKLTRKKAEISLESELPPGFGFGISGASALSAAYTLNKIFSLHISQKNLVQIAHIAEIENRTGLGTVGTQSSGGFLVKTSPGLPVKAKSYPFEGSTIYATVIGKLLTPSILKDSNRIRSINMTAKKNLEKLAVMEFPSLADFLDFSYVFVKESRLLGNPALIRIINDIRSSGGHATMAILGNVVISDIPPAGKSDYEVRKLTICKSKARLLKGSQR